MCRAGLSKEWPEDNTKAERYSLSPKELVAFASFGFPTSLFFSVCSADDEKKSWQKVSDRKFGGW